MTRVARGSRLYYVNGRYVPHRDAHAYWGTTLATLAQRCAAGDWERYVAPADRPAVSTWLSLRNVAATARALGQPYPSVRLRLLRAAAGLARQQPWTVRHSAHRQTLLALVAQHPGWRAALTPREVAAVEHLLTGATLKAVAVAVGMQPSNLAGLLYGHTRKLGVVGKLKLLASC